MKELMRWAGQYLIAAGSMFAILTAVDIGSGHAFAEGWKSNLSWAIVSAAIFIGARYWQAKNGAGCRACDTIRPK